MPRKFRYLNMKELVPEYSTPIFDNNGIVEFEHILICLAEVQKSGARVYFRPASNDFTCDGKKFFVSFGEAYQSENW